MLNHDLESDFFEHRFRIRMAFVNHLPKPGPIHHLLRVGLEIQIIDMEYNCELLHFPFHWVDRFEELDNPGDAVVPPNVSSGVGFKSCEPV